MDLPCTSPGCRARRPRGTAGRAWGAGGLFLILLLAGCATAPRGRPLSPGEREKNLESFDYVWSTIQKKHWDPHFNGVNWDSVRTVFRPQMETAATVSEARAVLGRVIATLGQSHFGIFPKDLYDEVDGSARGRPGGDGSTGIDLRVVDGHALVVRVEPGSPAALIGVRPGWEILRADKAEIPTVLKKLSASSHSGMSPEFLMTKAIEWRLKRNIGETLTIRFLNERNRAVNLRIDLARAKGNLVQMGNLPSVSVWIDTLRVDRNIGLVRFNLFMDPGAVMEAFNQAVASWMNLDGVVIDLRGNPGGLGGMAMGMAGWFFGEKGRLLGTMYTRESQLKFAVNPRPVTYMGPLAILVDALSASTSEIMAAGLKDLGRARIFGTRTAGAALPSVFERLPNGDGFQYAFANYISQGGTVLEKNGVVPDVLAAPSRESLLQGRDPALDAAIAWIHEKR